MVSTTLNADGAWKTGVGGPRAGTDDPAAIRRRGRRAKGGGMNEFGGSGAGLDNTDAWLASTQERAARAAAAAR